MTADKALPDYVLLSSRVSGRLLDVNFNGEEGLGTSANFW